MIAINIGILIVAIVGIRIIPVPNPTIYWLTAAAGLLLFVVSGFF